MHRLIRRDCTSPASSTRLQARAAIGLTTGVMAAREPLLQARLLPAQWVGLGQPGGCVPDAVDRLMVATCRDCWPGTPACFAALGVGGQPVFLRPVLQRSAVDRD